MREGTALMDLAMEVSNDRLETCKVMLAALRNWAKSGSVARSCMTRSCCEASMRKGAPRYETWPTDVSASGATLAAAQSYRCTGTLRVTNEASERSTPSMLALPGLMAM